MNEKYIIDRVEGNYVIIENENGDMHEISKEKINGIFSEGDMLIRREKYFEIDRDSTLDMKMKVKNKTKDMWEE